MMPITEKLATKESGQALLFEKFKIRDTAGFRLMLQKGEIDRAEECLQFIVNNKNKFPHYLPIWDRWLGDRQKEIKIYQAKKEAGELETISSRTKEEAQQELIDKFEGLNIRKTSDFIRILNEGKIEIAKEWLQHIIDNKNSFPQYIGCWDRWLSDRQREIREAENNN